MKMKLYIKYLSTNFSRFLYLKKYNLDEIKTISFKAKKFIKENKIK